jgi:hypothetical protein
MQKAFSRNRWIKEVGKSKKEIDIAPFKTAIMEKSSQHFLPSHASASADNVAVWQALVCLLRVLYCKRITQ